MFFSSHSCFTFHSLIPHSYSSHRFSYILPHLSLLPSLQVFTQSLIHSLLFSSSFSPSVTNSFLLSLPRFATINSSIIHSQLNSLLQQLHSFNHFAVLTRFILSFIAANVKITEEEAISIRDEITSIFTIPESDVLKPEVYKIKLEFISACLEYQKYFSIELFQKSDIIKEFPKLLVFPPRLLRSDNYRPYAIRSVIECMKDNQIDVIPQNSSNHTVVELCSELCSGHFDISWYDQISENQKELMIECVCEYCCTTAGMLETGMELVLKGMNTYRVTHQGDVGSKIRLRSLMECQRLLRCMNGVSDCEMGTSGLNQYNTIQSEDKTDIKSSEITQSIRDDSELNHSYIVRNRLGIALASSSYITYFPFTLGYLIYSNQSQPSVSTPHTITPSLTNSQLLLLTNITHSLLTLLAEQNSAVRMRATEILFLLANPVFTQSSFISAVIQAFPPTLTNPTSYSQATIIDVIFDNLCNSIFIHDFCKGVVFLVGGITPIISDQARHRLVSIVSTEIGKKRIVPEFVMILSQSVDNKRNELIAALKTVIVCLSCTSEMSSDLSRTLCEICLTLSKRHERNRVVMTNVSELINLVGDGFPVEARAELLNRLLQSTFNNVRENATEFKLLVLNE